MSYTWQEVVSPGKVAPNGLGYGELYCPNCKHYIGKEGVILGAIVVKCRFCKRTWVVEINRVGEGVVEGEEQTPDVG